MKDNQARYKINILDNLDVAIEDEQTGQPLVVELTEREFEQLVATGRGVSSEPSLMNNEELLSLGLKRVLGLLLDTLKTN
jgi:hypothetical protein